MLSESDERADVESRSVRVTKRRADRTEREKKSTAVIPGAIVPTVLARPGERIRLLIVRLGNGRKL